MSELIFWLIVIPVAGASGAIWTIRQWRRDYPLSSGAVDYKRIAWPVGKSGVTFIGYQPTEPPEYIEPPQGGSVLAPMQSIESRIPSPSSGYTPLLNDDAYQCEETWNEALLKVHALPAPQIDPKLIGKDYR